MVYHGLSYRWQYYVTHPHTFVQDVYYRVKWFVQRGYRGYADCDVWSLDAYLNNWMPAAVRGLKNSIGYPGCLEGDPNAPDTWNTILETIAQGFDAGRALNEMEYDTTEQAQALQRKMYKGMGLFVKYYLNLWD